MLFKDWWSGGVSVPYGVNKKNKFINVKESVTKYIEVCQ